VSGAQPPDKLGRSRIEDPIASGLAVARAAQRIGELEVAETTLAELYAAYPAHAEVAGSYARLLLAQGRHEEARDVAIAGGPLVGMRAEAAGLAAFQLGELEAADAAFAALEVDAAATGHAAGAGRALLLRGLVAHRRGQLGLASERYREAARRLGDAGERHAAATAEVGLGAVLVERGRASEALPVLASAGAVFGELRSADEVSAAELHRASALLLVGQLDGARAAAEAALAGSEGSHPLRGRALIVTGEAHRRLGDEPAALRCYREALAIAALRDDARGQLRAHIALAEAGQRDGDGVVATPGRPRAGGWRCAIRRRWRARPARRSATRPSRSPGPAPRPRPAPAMPIASSARFAVTPSRRSSPSACASPAWRAAKPTTPA